MLRSNLSTRPFYNDRIVTLAIVLAIVAGLGLTAFNITQISSLTRQRAVYTEQIERDQNEAARVRAAAAALQQSVDAQQLKGLVASTQEANGLIDRRTFSWTAFFEHVEKTLPLDTRLVAVAPRIERGEFLIAMIVVAKAPGDLQRFTDALQNTGVFYDVLPAKTQMNDDGTISATIQAGYLPATPPAGRKGRP